MYKTLLFASLLVVVSSSPFRIWPNLDGRIIGGEDTTIEEYPYQISLQYNGRHNCGGSILNRSIILTAAHCTNGFRVSAMSVRAGSSKSYEGGQLIRVNKIIQHEHFNPYNFDNDVSLLVLDSPLKYGSGVGPVALQDEGNEIPAGTRAIVTGWGDTGIGSGDPDVLQRVNLDVISESQCKDEYNTDAEVTDTMLCCQSPGKDSCQGDSGGPLVANGKQIGVVSWGIGCADPEYPGVYSKISALRSWIDKHMNS